MDSPSKIFAFSAALALGAPLFGDLLRHLYKDGGGWREKRRTRRAFEQARQELMGDHGGEGS